VINGLDLFSGIGGLTLALSPWVKPVAYCENDRYAQSVLLSRMRDGSLPCAWIWDDVRTLRADHIGLPEVGIDIVYGGFPCQDISVAGAGKGLDGERSGLIKELYRLVGEIGPTFIFLENVPAIRSRGADSIVAELAGRGYDCRWTVVSAAEIGAIHIRKRWFLLAHANGERLRKELREKVGRNNSERKRQMESYGIGSPWGIAGSPKRTLTPRVDGAGDGIPHRVDRHKGLGNAVVPAQARKAFEKLMGLK
jgi:DNA (cytosine-5)-methyltransferase 1